MNYAFQVAPHPNVYYAGALNELASAELTGMLNSMSYHPEIRCHRIGGSSFLLFETGEPLKPDELRQLACHSSLLLMAEREDDTLKPLDIEPALYLDRSLADIPRYKGKTGASFTRMMLNLAMAAAGRTADAAPALVFDPLCGRGTTLLCALELGHDAVGIDINRNDLRDGMGYLEGYLERERIKHKLKQGSRTIGKLSVPEASYELADTKAHWQADEKRTLTLYHGDSTAIAGSLMRGRPADVLVTDLPYGVQHAPKAGGSVSGFEAFLKQAFAGWLPAMQRGGVAVISFNTLTVKREALKDSLTEAGWQVLTEPPFDAHPHRLEQAVIRDFVAAVRPS